MTEAWIITCLGLMILPGPDMALVTKESLAKGWRGGAGIILGLYLSFLFYSAAILLGIIPLLNSWPTFFLLARILGGLYLIYLGIKGIREADNERELGLSDNFSGGLVRSGFVSNALNAKQYLFLFLLLPSFLPSNPSWMDIFYLLLILFLVSLLFWILWVSLVVRLRDRMKHHHRKVEVASSSALIVVGILLVLGFL